MKSGGGRGESEKKREKSAGENFCPRSKRSCCLRSARGRIGMKGEGRGMSPRAMGALSRRGTRPQGRGAGGGRGGGGQRMVAHSRCFLRLCAAQMRSEGAAVHAISPLLKEWAAHTHPARRGGKPRRCQLPRAVGLADRDCARTRRTKSEFGSAICAARGA